MWVVEGVGIVLLSIGCVVFAVLWRETLKERDQLWEGMTEWIRKHRKLSDDYTEEKNAAAKLQNLYETLLEVHNKAMDAGKDCARENNDLKEDVRRLGLCRTELNERAAKLNEEVIALRGLRGLEEAARDTLERENERLCGVVDSLRSGLGGVQAALGGILATLDKVQKKEPTGLSVILESTVKIDGPVPVPCVKEEVSRTREETTEPSLVLYNRLLEKPGDTDLMLKLSSALCCEGKMLLGRAYQWAAERNRWPFERTARWDSVTYETTRKVWDWERVGRMLSSPDVPECAQLPLELFSFMRHLPGRKYGSVMRAFILLGNTLKGMEQYDGMGWNEEVGRWFPTADEENTGT